MPSKDPKTGRELSGAAKARARAARDEQERRAEARRRAALTGDAAASDRPDLEPFRRLGPPPTDVTVTAEWAVRVASVLLHEIVTDPMLTAPDRRRAAGEIIGKLGLVTQKAALQSKVRALTEKMAREVRSATPPADAAPAAPSPPQTKALRAPRRRS